MSSTQSSEEILVFASYEQHMAISQVLLSTGRSPGPPSRSLLIEQQVPVKSTLPCDQEQPVGTDGQRLLCHDLYVARKMQSRETLDSGICAARVNARDHQ